MSQQTTAGRRLSTASAPAPAAAPRNEVRRSVSLRWLFNSVSTGLVAAVLGGTAYWGHRTDWTMPKFSALLGREPPPADDWCAEHNVADSECIECHADLLAAGEDYGWCQRHGVAQCPLEHPDMAQLKAVPKITTAALERADRALALRPRAENNRRCALHRRRIQFASAEAIEKAGLDIDVVGESPLIEAIVAYGEVVYDETLTAHITSRAAGTVWRVDKQVGQRVEKGEVLALVDAADVGRAKGEFQRAIVQYRLQRTNVARLKSLAADSTVSGRQFREAESAFEDAQVRLRTAQQALVNLGLTARADEFLDLSTDETAERLQFLGLPKALAASLDGESTTSNLLPLTSLLDGVIVDRNVVAGEVVETTTQLFSVADVSRMWLTLNVRQDEAKYLALDERVLFQPSDDEDPGEIEGRLAWIATSADDRTRTVKVRVDLPNDDGRLLANTFGNGRIVLRDEPRAVVVPTEAIHWDGSCHVVFVRDKHFLEPDAPKFFHVRMVRLGVKQGDTTEIIAGLLPGEVIAGKNSVVLEAQLLKNDLGEGCGCCK